MRKRQKKPGKREIRSISLKKQTEKNKKQKTGLTKEEKKRLKELRIIKAENQKKRKPFTAQDTIPYKEIYKDGICRTDDNYYSKMVQFYDINYQLAQNDDKAAIFNDTATTEIYTLSIHDALPIYLTALLRYKLHFLINR